MIEIIGIVVLSILAIIVIMAIIGFFIEKNEKIKAKEKEKVNIRKKVFAEIENNKDQVQLQPEIQVESPMKSDVAMEEVRENDNAVTNANIPEVLDFNSISKELEDK